MESVAKRWGLWQTGGHGEELPGLLGSSLNQCGDGRYVNKEYNNSDDLTAVSSFLWVTSAITALQQSDREASTAAKATPLSLQLVYKQFMADIAASSKSNASVAEHALYWLVFALSSLRTYDIIAALNISPSRPPTGEQPTSQSITAKTVRSCCKGLVTMDGENLVITHPSAYEFLTHALNNSLAHTYLAKMALAILTTMSPMHGGPMGRGQEKTREEALYEYAKKYYLIHGLKAIALDQRVGPYIDADSLPSFEERHQVGNA
jgi:hypothetical protein